MRVFNVYAHPNPKSFCHAVLDEFTRGLRDAGFDDEVVAAGLLHDSVEGSDATIAEIDDQFAKFERLLKVYKGKVPGVIEELFAETLRQLAAAAEIR